MSRYNFFFHNSKHCEYFYNFSNKITNVFKQENNEFCKDKKILIGIPPIQ